MLYYLGKNAEDNTNIIGKVHFFSIATLCVYWIDLLVPYLVAYYCTENMSKHCILREIKVWIDVLK